MISVRCVATTLRYLRRLIGCTHVVAFALEHVDVDGRSFIVLPDHARGRQVLTTFATTPGSLLGARHSPESVWRRASQSFTIQLNSNTAEKTSANAERFQMGRLVIFK